MYVFLENVRFYMLLVVHLSALGSHFSEFGWSTHYIVASVER